MDISCTEHIIPCYIGIIVYIMEQEDNPIFANFANLAYRLYSKYCFLKYLIYRPNCSKNTYPVRRIKTNLVKLFKARGHTQNAKSRVIYISKYSDLHVMTVYLNPMLTS